MSFPRPPHTALSAALEATDSSTAGEKNPRREEQAGAGSCLHPPPLPWAASAAPAAIPQKELSPVERGVGNCTGMAGNWLLPRAVSMSRSLPKALGFPRALKIPGENSTALKDGGGSFGVAVKQKLFSPKCLHWEFLCPNSDSKTRKPTRHCTSHLGQNHKHIFEA